jgi:hypothetical protein
MRSFRLRNHRRIWTKDDDDILRTMLAEGASLRRIALKLNRTTKALVSRARASRIFLAGKLTSEERAQRRRRLTKGSLEFREHRVDLPKAKGK